jgi:DNA-binding transcriptional ArsR family regulator
VARAATTSDAFNAVSEPRRRQLLDALGAGERSVTELMTLVGLPQPLASKHLRVLRAVGLVTVRDDGRQRLYRVNAAALKPIHDWLRPYEEMWSARFARMDAVLAELELAELELAELELAEPGDEDPASPGVAADRPGQAAGNKPETEHGDDRDDE